MFIIEADVVVRNFYFILRPLVTLLRREVARWRELMPLSRTELRTETFLYHRSRVMLSMNSNLIKLYCQQYDFDVKDSLLVSIGRTKAAIRYEKKPTHHKSYMCYTKIGNCHRDSEL